MNIEHEIDYDAFYSIRNFHSALDKVSYENNRDLYYDVRGAEQFELDLVESIYFNIEDIIYEY